MSTQSIPSAAASPQDTAASLVALLNDKGQGDYIGEAISQLAHSLQAAAQAAESGADDETVLAALLHDVGQFLPADQVRSLAHEARDMDEHVGRVGHEKIGEAYLRSLGFSSKVGFLVGSHVAAKRFLCAVEPAYHDSLSEASKKSLIFQGGPMTGDELAVWRTHPYCDDMCRLRQWDDRAKVVGLDVPSADSYETMMVNHLTRMATLA